MAGVLLCPDERCRPRPFIGRGPLEVLAGFSGIFAILAVTALVIVTVGLWARTELTCVVAEGSGSDDEVSRLRAHAPPGAVTITVATTLDLETAIARAQLDPTRGISKDRNFLSRIYQGWTEELARINPDVVIDTDRCTVDQGVERVRATLASARLSRAGSP